MFVATFVGAATFGTMSAFMTNYWALIACRMLGGINSVVRSVIGIFPITHIVGSNQGG